MKDYTKYNFAAIVGAEAKIVFENVGTDEPLVAKILGYDPKTKFVFIKVLEPHPCFWCCSRTETIQVSDILTLSAKIKVEDMSVKQLKKWLEVDICETLFLNAMNNSICRCEPTENGFVECENGKHLDNYIDCTDWGWKHE